MEKCVVTPVPQMVEETMDVRKSVPQSDVVRDKSLGDRLGRLACGSPLCLTGIAPQL